MRPGPSHCGTTGSTRSGKETPEEQSMAVPAALPTHVDIENRNTLCSAFHPVCARPLSPFIHPSTHIHTGPFFAGMVALPAATPSSSLSTSGKAVGGSNSSAMTGTAQISTASNEQCSSASSSPRWECSQAAARPLSPSRQVCDNHKKERKTCSSHHPPRHTSRTTLVTLPDHHSQTTNGH